MHGTGVKISVSIIQPMRHTDISLNYQQRYVIAVFQ
jgi:hypothetical protein